MKRRTKNLTSVFCGAVFALALIAGGSVVASELKEVPAAAASHGVKISADDFDDTSFVLSSSTADAGGLLYSFAGAESLSLAGKTGLAIRVKNLSTEEYKINQFRVYTKDSPLVYSPYNSTIPFLWMSGGLTETSHNARYLIIPANFDGYMLLPFDQMVVIRNSSNAWDWNARTHLSAEGEGDNALPTGECNQVAFFSLASTQGKELMFGEHTTYIKQESDYIKDEGTTADLQTAAKPSSEPLMTVASVTSLTCNFSGDEHVRFSSPSKSIPYGYSLTVPATFDFDYAHGSITIGEGDDKIVQERLQIKNTYRQDTVFEVFTESKEINLDDSSRILDPEDNGTTSTNYGGSFPFASTISAAGSDGMVFRVRNTMNTEYLIDTLYINGTGGAQWSLLNSDVTYISIDGTVSFYCPGGGETVKYRNTRIPALFDGYMVIPFSELVATHVDSTIDDAYNWNRFEKDKLIKGSLDVWTAYPDGGITGINIYFKTGSGNEGRNELILGEAGVYTGEAAEFRLSDSTCFDGTIKSLTANGGLVTISAYPETVSAVTLKVNGMVGVSDDSLSLNYASSEIQLTYGEKLSFEPVVSLGYALNRIELGGDGTGTLEEPLFINLDRDGGNYELDFITEEILSFQAGDGQIVSLQDKKGIKVKVNNSGDSAVEYRIIITDGERQYIASSVGVGLYETENIVTYGNVFSIPAGYEGTVYIPFNVWRGSTYGGVQNLPFDYSEGEKPEEVTGKIYFDCRSGQDKEILESAFKDWTYVTELPAPSKADVSEANLYKEGDRDFIGGMLSDPNTTMTASSAGQAKAIRITPSEELAFGVAGFAVRVKNISGSDFGIRGYFIGSDNKTYVPTAKNYYTLIAKDGTTENIVDNNRNIIIPKDFDGTFVIHFADFATDSVTAGQTQNILREGLFIKYFNFYSAGTAGNGILFGKAAVIDYSGTASAVDCFTPLTVSDPNAGGAFSLKEIRAVSVNSENKEAVISPSEVIFGTTTVSVSPVKDKLITSVIAPEGCTVSDNRDGTFNVEIVFPYTSQETDFTLEIASVDALFVSITAGEHGLVTYKGMDASDGIIVPTGSDYTLLVTPETGYEAIVKAGENLISSQNGEYVIPADCTSVAIEFRALKADLSVKLNGKGGAVFDDETLIDGTISIEQGGHLLILTPEQGYSAIVLLNGETLEEKENSYELFVYENSSLEISFQAIVYKIHYDLDRGTNGENPSSYTINDEVTFAAASKEGYAFLRWYILENGAKKTVSGIEKGTMGDITVYAEFERTEVPASGHPTKSGCGSSVVGFTGIAVLFVAFSGLSIIKMKRNGGKDD